MDINRGPLACAGGASHKRLHHQVTWNNAAVKIIHERHKKVCTQPGGKQ
ncbi:hypothetical protein R950_002630 [Salmonella enterica subsp. enterica]|nr:hypothetical protein [Salmonella enterica subsp. enterica serovar Langford]EED8424378.1 hypothetical protein [Salmonella enterica subsp. enterica serovar Losangeles]